MPLSSTHHASGITRHPLVDSHVHLDRFPPEAVPGLVRRAHEAGVNMLLSVGLDVQTSEQASLLAQQHPGVLAAAGVHPRWLHQVDPETALAEVERLARSGRVVAIGEVGLEYADGVAPAEVQQAFFGACLDLARRLDLAAVLHVVGAHEDALRVLAQHAPVRAVVHYFQGDAALARRYLEAGCLISVGKPVTRPENAALREAMASLPLDRLLLETDSYPLPGRTTEPRDVVEICRAVAELRGAEADEVASATRANFRSLLGDGGGEGRKQSSR